MPFLSVFPFLGHVLNFLRHKQNDLRLKQTLFVYILILLKTVPATVLSAYRRPGAGLAVGNSLSYI